jgi:hypothetical protein
MPPFAFVVPNRYNDMHDGTVAQGDHWLSTYLPKVQLSSWYASGGVVIITWDEGQTTKGVNGGKGGGHVATVVISKHAQGRGAYPANGNHYGTLRAIEDAYGVGRLGGSRDSLNGNLAPAF